MRGEEKLSPPPPSSFLFFSLSSQLPRRIRAEMLAMQAAKVAEFYRCLYAEGGGGGGQVGAPPKQMSEKFCGFWSSIFAHFNALLSDLVTFKVSYSSFKVIFPAVSMDICSVVLTKT